MALRKTTALQSGEVACAKCTRKVAIAYMNKAGDSLCKECKTLEDNDCGSSDTEGDLE